MSNKQLSNDEQQTITQELEHPECSTNLLCFILQIPQILHTHTHTSFVTLEGSFQRALGLALIYYINIFITKHCDQEALIKK